MTDAIARSNQSRRYLLVLVDQGEGDLLPELADFGEGVRDDEVIRHHHQVQVSASDEFVEPRPRRDVLIGMPTWDPPETLPPRFNTTLPSAANRLRDGSAVRTGDQRSISYKRMGL